MKKSILLFLAILYGSTSFGAMVERDGISITYNVCTKYSTISGSKPYCIKISNNSDNKIVFDSSLITPSIFDEVDIERGLESQRMLETLKNFLIGVVPPAVITGFFQKAIHHDVVKSITQAAKKLNQQVGDKMKTNFDLFSSTVEGVGLLTAMAAFFYLDKIDQDKRKAQKQKALIGKVVLNPGESIEKLFWLKNPNDEVKINFDAIKVLK